MPWPLRWHSTTCVGVLCLPSCLGRLRLRTSRRLHLRPSRASACLPRLACLPTPPARPLSPPLSLPQSFSLAAADSLAVVFGDKHGPFCTALGLASSKARSWHYAKAIQVDEAKAKNNCS